MIWVQLLNQWLSVSLLRNPDHTLEVNQMVMQHNTNW